MSEINNSVWNNNCSDIDDFVLPFIPSSHCPYNRKYAVKFIPFFFHMLSIIGILGNIGSLWTCLRPSRPWNIASIGILNLAICDLAYLLSITPWTLYISADYNWKMGHIACILVKILYFVGLTSNTIFICTISIDRFLAIVFPLESRLLRTIQNSALVSLLLWTITALLMYLSYPNILYLVRGDGVQICGVVVIAKLKSTEATYNLLYYYSIQVFVPLLLIIPSYIMIVARMKHTRKQWGHANFHVQDKTICIIFMFIANFLICWLPGQLLHLVACILFFTLNDCNNICWVAWVVNVLVEISEILCCLNSCLDPFIFHMHQSYFQQLHRAVGQWICCGQRCLQKRENQNLREAPLKPVSAVQL